MKKPTLRTPEELAWEILAYLARRPAAMDTAEGIANWWLMEERILQTNEAVQEALNELVTQKLVILWQGSDGRVFYRLNPEKKEEAGRLLHQHCAARQPNQMNEEKEKRS